MPASPRQQTAPQVETHRFAISAGGQVEITGAFRRVSLRAHDRPEVVVETHVRAPGGPPGRPGGPSVQLVRHVVQVSLLSGPFRHAGLDAPASLEARVEIRVPAALHLVLRTSGSEIHVQDVEGSFDIEASGGSLRLERVHGDVHVRARHCPVIARDISGPNITLHTTGGALDATGLRGPHLALFVHAGWSVLRDLDGPLHLVVSGGTAELEGLTGSIDGALYGGALTARLRSSCPARFHAAGGNLHLLVAPTFAAALRLEAPVVELDAGLAFVGERRDGFAEGQLRSGGPRLEAYGATGRLRLARLADGAAAG